MEQYVKVITKALSIFILSSCAVLSSFEGESIIDRGVDTKQVDDFNFQIRYVLCEEDTVLVDPCAYKRILPSHLEQCLRSRGFNGDLDANSTIKALYQCNSDLRFRGDLPPFRGRDLFKIFMESSHNFDLIEYPEPTEGLPYPSHIVTKAGTFKRFYFQSMVDSIGNYPASQYHEYVSEITGYYKWQIPPISREADSIHYVHILDAWQKGLIKLKPYGEE